MDITKENLKLSSVYKNKKTRDEILENDLSGFSKTQIENMKEFIDLELLILATQAQAQADFYWISSMSVNQDTLKQKTVSTGTRVRILCASVVCEWYRSKFRYIPKSKQGEKKCNVHSTYIPKTVSNSYSKNAFNYEAPEIKELVFIVEDEYKKIRLRSKALTKLRQAINNYEKLLKDV